MVLKKFVRTAAIAAGFILVLSIAPLAPGEDEGEEPKYTFYRDILPIFQRHCIRCHSEGGPNSQVLTDYDKARPFIRTSKRMVADGEMPPWHADPKIGHWRNAPTLGEDEAQIILDWTADKAPAGDEADAPERIDVSNPWPLGPPDRVLSMSEGFEIPSTGADLYRAFVLSPAFEEDTWLSAIQIAPGAKRVTRDMWVGSAPTAAAATADGADEGPGFALFDGGWTEGSKDFLAVWNKGLSIAEPFPAGSGVLIPAGHSLVLVAHYKPKDDAFTDQAQVGLYLADPPPAKEVKTLVVENREIIVPEESYDHRVKAELTLEESILVHSILPRMHYLGMEIELVAHPPGGEARKLIKIRSYNYAVQTRYLPAEPIELAAGTRLEAIAVYENSVDNPNNPNMLIEDAPYGPAPENEILSFVLQYTEQ